MSGARPRSRRIVARLSNFILLFNFRSRCTRIFAGRVFRVSTYLLTQLKARHSVAALRCYAVSANDDTRRPLLVAYVLYIAYQILANGLYAVTVSFLLYYKLLPAMMQKR
jgi:hypothetical protein